MGCGFHDTALRYCISRAGPACDDFQNLSQQGYELVLSAHPCSDTCIHISDSKSQLEESGLWEEKVSVEKQTDASRIRRSSRNGGLCNRCRRVENFKWRICECNCYANSTICF